MSNSLKVCLIGWVVFFLSLFSGCYDGPTLSLEPDAGVEHDLLTAERSLDDALQAMDEVGHIISECYQLPGIDPARCDALSPPFYAARQRVLDAYHTLDELRQADQGIKALVK